MESKNQKKLFITFVIIFALLTFATISISIYHFITTSKQLLSRSRTADHDTRNYHIIVTGRYENQLFMQRVFEGANRYSDYYNSVVELYVPGSQAEDVPVQELLDYVSYVNADGVILFNESSDSQLIIPRRTDDTIIPLVTTGQYNANLPQISYIGTSYWELGKKISDEVAFYLHGNGNAVIISNDISSTSNYSNLLNSLQDGLKLHKSIHYSILENNLDERTIENTNIFICLSEEDTIKVAQTLQELIPQNKIGLLGFGTNETCQLYLDKGIVSELIEVDPEKIGETAIKELFEYRNKGYANSYIAADVQILGGDHEPNHLH